MDPRATVSRIYKEDHYTLLNTNYKSSGPCGFGEELFFYVFHLTPPGRGPFGPQGHSWQDLYRGHYTLLHTKFESSGPCGFGEEYFFMFFP